jgi:hypothetical protein
MNQELLDGKVRLDCSGELIDAESTVCARSPNCGWSAHRIRVPALQCVHDSARFA